MLTSYPVDEDAGGAGLSRRHRHSPLLQDFFVLEVAVFGIVLLLPSCDLCLTFGHYSSVVFRSSSNSFVPFLSLILHLFINLCFCPSFCKRSSVSWYIALSLPPCIFLCSLDHCCTPHYLPPSPSLSLAFSLSPTPPLPSSSLSLWLPPSLPTSLPHPSLSLHL